jgi:hypothetical protein
VYSVCCQAERRKSLFSSEEKWKPDCDFYGQLRRNLITEDLYDYSARLLRIHDKVFTRAIIQAISVDTAAKIHELPIWN